MISMEIMHDLRVLHAGRGSVETLIYAGVEFDSHSVALLTAWC